MSLLLKIEIQFPLHHLSLLRPIDTKFSIWVAYIKRHLGIAYQVPRIKVTVAKNGKLDSTQYLEFA